MAAELKPRKGFYLCRNARGNMIELTATQKRILERLRTGPVYASREYPYSACMALVRKGLASHQVEHSGDYVRRRNVMGGGVVYEWDHRRHEFNVFRLAGE